MQLLDGFAALKIIDALAGLVIIGLSIPKGVIKEKYGVWDKYVF
ncbi:hypothetical protein [Segetibacter koreensis]|nr:hypothetical protein [Segetibacter koreensis]